MNHIFHDASSLSEAKVSRFSGQNLSKKEEELAITYPFQTSGPAGIERTLRKSEGSKEASQSIFGGNYLKRRLI